MTHSLPRLEALLTALHDQNFFQCEKTEGSALWYIAYYKRRTPIRRIAFRSLDFVLLFLSISLPFLIETAPAPIKSQLASIIAWLLAIIAATNSFFNWQKTWEQYTQTQLKVEFSILTWKLRSANFE